MTQATAVNPVVEERKCASCPFFQSHDEPEHLVDNKGNRFNKVIRDTEFSSASLTFNNPRHGCGWCNLFNQPAKEHHQMTQGCILNGSLNVEEDEVVVTHELEDNLTFFPEVDFDELDALEAFPNEEIIDSNDLPRSEYEVGSVVKIIDEREDHTEWGVFKVVKVRQNINLYNDPESYLNGSPWHYLLASRDTAQKLDGVWVKENELCHFNESYLISTNEDIF